MTHFGGQNVMAYPHAAMQSDRRIHSRQESGSTVASSVLDSPYPYATLLNGDSLPQFYHLVDDSVYKPSTLSHTPLYPSALPFDTTGLATMDNGAKQGAYGTPTATPRGSSCVVGGGDDADSKLTRVISNPPPNISLFRTESAAFQDELYNPADFDQSAVTSTPQQRPTSQNVNKNNNNLLSPSRNLVNEFMKTADSVRSNNPSQHSARDLSPFRNGSPLAPPTDFHQNRPTQLLNTMAAMRRQRNAQSAAQELSVHQPVLRREITKTISPKDAMLEYNEPDHDKSASLFADTLSDTYQYQAQTPQFPSTADAFNGNFLNGMSQYMSIQQPNGFGFRTADGNATNRRRTPSSNLSSATRRSQQQHHHQQLPHSTNIQSSPRIGADAVPDFPAHLTSMESSVSENVGSSQEMNPPAKRQRLSEDIPRQSQHQLHQHQHQRRHSSNRPTTLPTAALSSPANNTTTSSPYTTSPRSDHDDSDPDLEHVPTSGQENGSDEPVGHQLSSSAISARNSQLGPHRCDRINPATGQVCNIVFSRPYDLTRHEDTIHSRKKHKVPCDFCVELKTFSRADALTRHMRVVHPEIEFHPKKARQAF